MKNSSFIDKAIEAINNQRLPNALKEVINHAITMHVNTECLDCQRFKINRGQCSGKRGGNPCVAFKETNLFNIN